MPETTKKCDTLQKADIVIIDGNQNMRDLLIKLLKERGKVVDAYSCPKDLLANLSKYNKDTKISFGNVFEADIQGLELAKRLHKEGYTDLNMLTWSDFKFNQIPHYLRYFPKNIDDCRDDIDRLLSDRKSIGGLMESALLH